MSTENPYAAPEEKPKKVAAKKEPAAKKTAKKAPAKDDGPSTPPDTGKTAEKANKDLS